MTSRHGHRVSVSSWRAGRSGCRNARGVITVKVFRVGPGGARQGRRVCPGGCIQPNCPRPKNKPCSRCCARRGFAMSGCWSAGRHCLTRASIGVRRRRCTASWENTACPGNDANDPDMIAITVAGWSPRHRTWCGSGTSPDSPAPAKGSSSTCTRSGTCGHARPSAGASTPKRPPRSPNG